MDTTLNNYVPGIMDLLPADVRAAILASGYRVKLESGQLFQNRGKRLAALCIIVKGKLRMMTIGVDGSMLLSAILGPGQQFNEATLFANTACPHDAEAMGDTEILVLSRRDYEILAERHPSIVNALMVSSVGRLHQFIEALNDLRALPKSVAVARFLLKNARQMNGDPRVNSVELGVTQEDIAMWLGVTRAYLNRIVGELCGIGLIEVSYRRIHIPDVTRLRNWIVEQLTYETLEIQGAAVG